MELFRRSRGNKSSWHVHGDFTACKHWQISVLNSTEVL